ncbi:MAG: hypothetical protein GX312_05775 [Candidatus Phytoplasma sp.]|nr:hypothetical protein [Phytoplasma sp.]
MEQYVEQENTISLLEIVEVIKEKFWFLVLTTLIGGFLLAGYAFFIAKPTYKSTGAIMIQVETSEGSVNTVESQRLVQSAVDILTKIDLISDETSLELSKQGINLSGKQIRDKMSVQSSANSLVISISFSNQEAKIAELTVDTIIKTLIKVVNDESYKMEYTLKNNISNLYVGEAKDVSTNKLLMIFVGILLGGIVGMVIVFINEAVNSGYKTKESIEADFKLLTLGSVSEFIVKRG